MSQNDPVHDALQPLRAKIDEIDQQIVRLLNERANVVIEVGKVKNNADAPIYVPHRERLVIDRVMAANEGPLPDPTLEAIYREIISGSIALERPLRVGFLGPAGSFSQVAAKRYFGASVEYIAEETIPQVFQAVERQAIDVGLVPIENSTGGGVTETLDTFLQSSVKVCAEVLIRIHHNLLSQHEASDVKRIYSRPEVFEQCRKWLADHLRHAERLPMASSAKAAERAANESGAAAIGSSLAAEAYALPVQYPNIEDNPNNVTRFFVIGRLDAQPTGNDKTAIMFTTAHKPGALAEVLDVFSRHEVNLTHIDKRPSQRVNWEYFFFVDCEGHIHQANMQAALDEARNHCLHLTVLGSFPKARNPLE